MSIKFPNQAEIQLNKAPLDEVICQVKFPPILRIAKDTPFEFQEAVRERFPELHADHGMVVQIPTLVSPEKLALESSSKSHRFLTFNGNSYIALNPDFIALATKQYTHWENFKSDLDMTIKALREIYQPSYATRIGLRFINRFTRKNTGCKNLNEMLDLFRTELTCLLRTEVWTEPTEMLTQIILKDGQGKLALRSGLGKDQNDSFFILDFDYFEEGQLPLESLNKRIERYHFRIYNAFRWCLLEDSLNHFEPLKEN
jgi:uncharacterized protein (TIGR04255 family)